MNSRERHLTGSHGFDWHWWIFDLSFSVTQLRDINNPKWLGLLLCKFGKHGWWLCSDTWSKPDYKCAKCGKIKYYSGKEDVEGLG